MMITHNGKKTRSRGELLIKVKPSPKERLILREIGNHGYTVSYLAGYFRQYRQYGDMFHSRLIAFTDPDTKMIVVSLRSFHNNRKDFSLLEILVHELSHVVSQAGISPVGGQLNAYTEAHGIKFCQVYTSLVNKHKIRNPDPRYYLRGY
jgi:hypothetical protein